MNKLFTMLFVLGVASAPVSLLQADEQEAEQVAEEKQEEVQELDVELEQADEQK